MFCTFHYLWQRKNTYSPNDVCFGCIYMVLQPVTPRIGTNAVAELELGGLIDRRSSGNGTKGFLLPHTAHNQTCLSQQLCAAYTHRASCSR